MTWVKFFRGERGTVIARQFNHYGRVQLPVYGFRPKDGEGWEVEVAIAKENFDLVRPVAGPFVVVIDEVRDACNVSPIRRFVPPVHEDRISAKGGGPTGGTFPVVYAYYTAEKVKEFEAKKAELLRPLLEEAEAAKKAFAEVVEGLGERLYAPYLAYFEWAGRRHTLSADKGYGAAEYTIILLNERDKRLGEWTIAQNGEALAFCKEVKRSLLTEVPN